MVVKVKFQADTRRAQRNVQNFSRSIGSIVKVAAGATAAITAITTAASAIRGADEVESLRNRIRAFSGDAAEAASRLGDVSRVARAQFQDLRGLGELYSRLQVSTQELGTTQEDLAAFTEAFAAGARVTSASAQESVAAAIQLSQGLAAGVLQGQELLSVLEQAPRVARAMAKGLGIAFGDLRKFAEEGKLTAEQVIPALVGQLDVLLDEAGRIPPTLTEMRTAFSTSFKLASAEIDQAGGVLATIKGQIAGLTEEVDTFAATLRGGAGIGLSVADSIIRGVEDGVAYIVERLSSIDLAGFSERLGQAVGAVVRSVINFFANIQPSDLSGFLNSLRLGMTDAVVSFALNLSKAVEDIDFARLGLRMVDTVLNFFNTITAAIARSLAALFNPIMERIENLVNAVNLFGAPANLGRFNEEFTATPLNFEQTFAGSGRVFTPVAGGALAPTNPFGDFLEEIKATAAEFRGGSPAGTGSAGDAATAAAESTVDLGAASNDAADAIGTLAAVTGNAALQAMDRFISTFEALNSVVNSVVSIIGNLGGAGGGAGGAAGLLTALGFQQGGVVPGVGVGDKVIAALEPGEVVYPNRYRDQAALAAQLGGNSSVTFQLEGDFDARAERAVVRLSRTGVIQQALNQSQVEAGYRPVFNTN